MDPSARVSASSTTGWGVHGARGRGAVIRRSALAADFAALPLRPTWLLAQLDRAPDAPHLATARAAAVRWLSARNALVDALHGFVVTLARRGATWHVPLEDRIQAGALALTVAIERFDPARGTRLTTYVGPAVERAIRRLERRTPRARAGPTLRDPDALAGLAVGAARAWGRVADERPPTMASRDDPGDARRAG